MNERADRSGRKTPPSSCRALPGVSVRRPLTMDRSAELPATGSGGPASGLRGDVAASPDEETARFRQLAECSGRVATDVVTYFAASQHRNANAGAAGYREISTTVCRPEPRC